MPRNMPESEDDFIRMQQDAIRRVREMQNRARRTLEDAGLHIDPPEDDAQFPQQDLPRSTDAHSSAAHSSAAHSSAAHSQAVYSQTEPTLDIAHGSPAASPASLARPPQTDAQRQHPGGQRTGQNARQMSPPAILQQLMNGGVTIPETVNLPVLNLSLDRDQILLIILLYILIKDGADQWLILALAYIMLL